MKETLVLIALLASNITICAKAQDKNEQAIIANAATKFLVLSSQEKWLEAKPFVQQAYELGQTIYLASDSSFGPIAYHYGSVLAALKEPSALAPLTLALNNYEQHLGDNSEKLIPLLSDLASAHILSGNVDQAKLNFTRALKLASNEYGKNSTLVANLGSRAGREFVTTGNYKLALQLQNRAHEIYLNVFGATSAKAGIAAYDISESLRLNNSTLRQVRFLKEAMSSFDKSNNADSDFERQVHTRLVQAYHALGKPKKATTHVLALANSSTYTDTQAPVLLVKTDVSDLGRRANKKLQGFVSLKFDVDSKGFTRNARLIELEGDQKLIALAIDTLSAYRYIPEVSNGEPIEANDMETKIIFKWDT